MLFYVAHAYGDSEDNYERAERITHDLQVNDTENCYICPLMVFSHLCYDEIPYDVSMDLCIDILSVCDKLIVASEVSDGVRREIEFADMVGMEVQYLETD